MKGQDNRCTAQPIFIVQQRRRIYGFDPPYSDDYVWLYVDEAVEVSDEKELAQIEAEYERTGKEPAEYIRTFYQDFWEWVQPFFSEEGAQTYITCNRHNLTDPRIYVESAYRNDEWAAVREMLIDAGKGS
jgi:hypothetical protein